MKWRRFNSGCNAVYETDGWTEEKKAELVQGWHRQRGWPDSMAGLMRLREKFFV
jgi:hypothetical protein